LLAVAAKQLAANRPRLVVFTAGAVATALASASIATASVVSLATMRQTIDDGWRGAYDILVRPSGMAALRADGRNLVPANYLGSRSEGITQEQWDRIKGIPGVEVAAPVAALGWMRQNDVAFEVHLKPQAGLAYRIRAETSIGGQSATGATAYVGLNPNDPARPALFIGATDLAAGGGEMDVTLGALPSWWVEVVGVDPEQETRLIGLESYLRSGKYLSPGVSMTQDELFDRQAIAVPVITASSASIPGRATVTIDSIAGIDEASLNERLTAVINSGASPEEIDRTANELLSRAVVKRQQAVSTPLSALLAPFRPLAVVEEDGALSQRPETGGSTAYGRNVVLVPQPVPYDISAANHRPYLKAMGTWQSEIEPKIAAVQPPTFRAVPTGFGADNTIYRPLSVEVPSPFVVQPVGSYDLQAIAERYAGAANYAPLGIYQELPRRLASGRGAGDATFLAPSLNPGGLNPLPPLALTNLETVEALRGPRFIDAIRVRVEGISGYSSQAIQRIEDMAAAIVDRTGLAVTVVAGSSPIDTTVEVEGVGEVVERWTTLGEVPSIASGTDGLSGWLLWSSAILVLLYLAMFGVFLVGDQQAEFVTLRLIGWRRGNIFRLLLAESILLGSCAALAGSLATLTFSTLFGASRAVELSLGVFALVAVAHVAAVSVASLFLQPGTRAPGVDRGPRSMRGSTVYSVALSGIVQSPWKVISQAMLLALAVALAALILALEVGFGGRLRATILGQFVSVRLAPYHFLAAGAAIAAAVAMLAETGVLAVERRMAFVGLLRAIGWGRRHIRRILLVETAAYALPAAITAAVAVFALLNVVDSPPGTAAVAALTAMAASIAVAAAAGYPAVNLASRIPPGLLMRAEGFTSSVPGFARRSALLTTGTLATISIGGAIVWALVQPPAIATSAITHQPTPRPPGPAELRLSHDIAAIADIPDRRVGTPEIASALSYVSRALQDVGYQVEEFAYLSMAVTFIDKQGVAIDQDAALGSVIPVGVAYDPRRFGDQDLPASRLSFRDGRRLDAPAVECSAGTMILRIGTSVTDTSRASLGPQVGLRCLGRTDAVLTVTAPDDEWTEAAHMLAALRLPLGHVLIASPAGTVSMDGLPVMVAPVDSSGPGATQSATATALALESARQAKERDLPMRFAFGSISDGGLPSILARSLLAAPSVRVITLGRMGGPLATTVGTTDASAIRQTAEIRVALLATVALNESTARWLDVVSTARPKATSPAFLDMVGATTGLSPTAFADQNVLYLSLGLDGLGIGEQSSPEEFVGSIAGTPVDEAEQVHLEAIRDMPAQLIAAIGAAGR
jgi:putative ABC transport system permease protein